MAAPPRASPDRFDPTGRTLSILPSAHGSRAAATRSFSEGPATVFTLPETLLIHQHKPDSHARVEIPVNVNTVDQLSVQ